MSGEVIKINDGIDKLEYFANALIIDTNVELYEYSADIWDSYGVKSSRVDNINQALKEVSEYVYHLIVIVECKEQRQCVLDSIKLFRELTPAPIVIASIDPIDSEYRIEGLNLGADEVWEIPQYIEEAVAKGYAIIRRYFNLFNETANQGMIINNRIVLNTALRRVFIKGNKVELTKIEFDILTLLIRFPGKVFTHEYLYNKIWDAKYDESSKAVIWTHIKRLREKLRIDQESPQYIKTMREVGYCYDPYNQ